MHMQERDVSEVGRHSCEQSPLFWLQGLVPPVAEKRGLGATGVQGAPTRAGAAGAALT